MLKEFFALCSQYARYASGPLAKTQLLGDIYILSVSIIPLLPDRSIRVTLSFIESMLLIINSHI